MPASTGNIERSEISVKDEDSAYEVPDVVTEQVPGAVSDSSVVSVSLH